MEEENNIVFVFIAPLGEHLKKKKKPVISNGQSNEKSNALRHNLVKLLFCVLLLTKKNLYLIC